MKVLWRLVFFMMTYCLHTVVMDAMTCTSFSELDPQGDLQTTEFNSCTRQGFEGQIGTGNEIGIDTTIPDGMTQVCTKLNMISNCVTELTDWTATRTCTENWTESCVDQPSEGVPSPREISEMETIETIKNCGRTRIEACNIGRNGGGRAGDGGGGGDAAGKNSDGGDGGDGGGAGGASIGGGCSATVSLTCNNRIRAVIAPVPECPPAPVEVVCNVPSVIDCNCNCFKNNINTKTRSKPSSRKPQYGPATGRRRVGGYDSYRHWP